jgi:agmatinase
MSSDRVTNRKALLTHTASGMTYAGELSFLRCKYTRNIEGADVVISGIPFDSATTFRPGARMGPQAIRAASVQLAEILDRSFPFGFNPTEILAIADYGDCELDSGYPQNVVTAVEAHADNILESGSMMVTFGGDHFVTYPLLRAHAKKHGPLALLHFDAHVDTWEDDGQRLDHGSMFLRAKREGIIDVDHSVQVGIRSYSEEDHGFAVIDAPSVHEQSTGTTVKQILDRIGDKPVYLTFDIDCLDPAFAPGTGTPVAGGLSTAQALGILRGLGELNFVGMDLVEVAPAYDHAEITAIAAATLVHDFIGLLAAKKVAG